MTRSRQWPSALLYLAAALTAAPVATVAGAADPAKTIIGVELGARFTIPPCARGEETLTKRHCYVAAQTTKTPWGAEEHHVYYPSVVPIPYARGELVVDVLNGVIEAIHINTWGIEGQYSALEMLTKKYGPPTRERREKTKSQRARLPVVYAEWDLADFSVKLDGITSTFDWGRITLATHRHRKLAGAQAAAR